VKSAALGRSAAVAPAVVLVTLLGLAGSARARDLVAEGRYHLRKANALAGNDRCEAAIREYGLAYEKLHDPVVLFNRAECYRRIGEDADAAADYRAFLVAVPAAPNRAEVEAKIASLDLGPARGAPAPATGASASGAPAADSAAPALALPAPAANAAETSLAASLAAPARPPAETARRRRELWIWAALGAAVAGGAVVAYFVLRTPGATPPGTELGNYRF
jgi:hypothetical protein